MADNTPARDVSSRGLRIAITGATGFVGRALLSHLADETLTALCRGGANRGRGISHSVRWIDGDLDNQHACETLVNGADVVIHLAGLTKALSPEEFHHVNAQAAGALAEQAAKAGVPHFIFLSSLAATRPDVSDYAASKAAGEAAVLAHAGDMRVTTVRAPAVLGPGDDATKPLFMQLAKGFTVAPGGSARNSRFSVIDVQDLARFLADLARGHVEYTKPVAPYSQEIVDFAQMAEVTAEITGRKPRVISLPRPLVVGAGKLVDLWARVSGRPEVFSSNKVKEIYAGDWIADTAIDRPTSLKNTLHSCLMPYLRAKPLHDEHA